MAKTKRPITQEMTEMCYKKAKEIYPNEDKIKDAVESITEKTDMNSASARDYIKDFFYMREGTKLARAMAEKDARYYFENIYADYGNDGLKKAINSLQLYLASDKQNHPSLQLLINTFSEKYLHDEK